MVLRADGHMSSKDMPLTKSARVPSNVKFPYDAVPEKWMLNHIPDIFTEELGNYYSRGRNTLAHVHVAGQLDERLNGNWYLLMCLKCKATKHIADNKHFENRPLRMGTPRGHVPVFKTARDSVQGEAEYSDMVPLFQSPRIREWFWGSILEKFDILEKKEEAHKSRHH